MFDSLWRGSASLCERQKLDRQVFLSQILRILPEIATRVRQTVTISPNAKLLVEDHLSWLDQRIRIKREQTVRLHRMVSELNFRRWTSRPLCKLLFIVSHDIQRLWSIVLFLTVFSDVTAIPMTTPFGTNSLLPPVSIEGILDRRSPQTGKWIRSPTALIQIEAKQGHPAPPMSSIWADLPDSAIPRRNVIWPLLIFLSVVRPDSTLNPSAFASQSKIPVDPYSRKKNIRQPRAFDPPCTSGCL